jgi:predicted dehydrogenase
VIESLQEVAQAFDLRVPPSLRKGIGIVGAGGIVEYAHLPAYAKAGLEVIGVFDLNLERAQTLAQAHGLTAFASLDALLADPRVQVVDIAVLPHAQPEIALTALKAGKHLLCQKPLALELSAAREIEREAHSRGLAVVVNQQLRYSESLTVAREMIRQGWIGEANFMQVNVNVLTDWSLWPWLFNSPRLEVMFHSIHYLDAVRSFFGDPERVFCMASRMPGQAALGETRTVSNLIYAGERRALVTANHENRSQDNLAAFRIEGTGGAIRGTLGLMYDYPQGRVDTLEVKGQQTDGWVPYPVTTRWLPDAFIGPMRALLQAIETGQEASSSARDNLGTVRLVQALYQSMDSHQSVIVGEA